MVCCLSFFVSCLLLVVVCCVFGVHDDEGDVDDDDWLCSLSGFDVQCILDSRKVQHVSKDIGKILMSRMHFRSIMGKLPISKQIFLRGPPLHKIKDLAGARLFFSRGTWVVGPLSKNADFCCVWSTCTQAISEIVHSCISSCSFSAILRSSKLENVFGILNIFFCPGKIPVLGIFWRPVRRSQNMAMCPKYIQHGIITT